MRYVATMVLGLLLLASTAAAQETLQVTAHDDDGFYFTVEGLDGKNPTITLRPGAEYSVHFVNEGPTHVHNLAFGGPIDESTAIIASGENQTLNFTVPEDASDDAQYWCDPHRGVGMLGDVEFSAENGEGGNGEGRDGGNGTGDGGDGGSNGIPWPGGTLLLTALAGLALLRRRS